MLIAQLKSILKNHLYKKSRLKINNIKQYVIKRIVNK